MDFSRRTMRTATWLGALLLLFSLSIDVAAQDPPPPPPPGDGTNPPPPGDGTNPPPPGDDKPPPPGDDTKPPPPGDGTNPPPPGDGTNPPPPGDGTNPPPPGDGTNPPPPGDGTNPPPPGDGTNPPPPGDGTNPPPPGDGTNPPPPGDGTNPPPPGDGTNPPPPGDGTNPPPPGDDTNPPPPGDGTNPPPPGDVGIGGPPVREQCDADGSNCHKVVDLCDETGTCRALTIEECETDEKCSELLAGPPAGDGTNPPPPGDGTNPPPPGDVAGPPVREECDADGTNCHKVIDLCDETGTCRALTIEECEADEKCRELLAGPPAGDGTNPPPPGDGTNPPPPGDGTNPPPPGDGDVAGPPVREECDADGTNCHKVIDLCDETGTCRALTIEECEADEKCRELLAGPPAGDGTNPPPPGDGTNPPPPGDGGVAGPPVREECDADGSNCRKVIDLCDETGVCQVLTIEECEADEKCSELLAGPPAGEPGRPPGDGMTGPPIRLECDADGTNCREVLDVCNAAGECRVVTVEECRQDETCRDLVAGGPTPPREPRDPTRPPGDGGLQPPTREVCDDDGTCRQVVDVCNEDGECRVVPVEQCREDEKCRDLLAGGDPGDPGDPGRPPGDGGLQPPVREECDADGTCRQVVDVCDEAGECRVVSVEECREDEKCRDLLAGPPTGGPGEPGQPGDRPGPQPEGSLGHLIEQLRQRFDDNERARINVRDILGQLNDDNDKRFLERLAGIDGQLTRQEFQQAFGSGPLDSIAEPPTLAFFEGQLDGIDLGARLLIINREEYTVGPDVRIEGGNGNPLEVKALLEMVGNRPKVAVELNPDGQIQRLVVLSRINVTDTPPAAATQDFFGPVGLIDEGKIVLSGPRFVTTSRTRFVDAANQAVDRTTLSAGTLVSVTPGAPDITSGSFDPTATRVQVVDPRKPPPARADIITGHLINVDPVELDGPKARLTAETSFADEAGSALRAADISRGTFVRVTTRAPGFGEDAPVAVSIVVLAGDFVDAPPPLPVDEGDEPIVFEEIRVEGFVQSTGSDYIVLRGQRLALDDRVRVATLSGEQGDLNSLQAGDLLELDTRPHRNGFIVTRIQMIDPAVQTLSSPGVLVGAFDAIDGTELVLAGPFFKVPADSEVKLHGGRDGALSDLAVDDYVRLSASPPRFDRGETLPVAFKIRVSTSPQGPPVARPGDNGQPGEPGGQGSGDSPAEPAPVGNNRRVVNSFPEDGDVAIQTKTSVQVRFNGNVSGLLFDPEFQFTLFPKPTSLSGLQVSADGRTISAEVQLVKDVDYQLVVLSQKTGLFTARFSTGQQSASGTILGDIVLPPELPGQSRFVPGESFAVLLDQAPVGALDMRNLEDHVIAGLPLNGPRIEFNNVGEGSYYLVLFVNIDLGRGEVLQIRAAYDNDGDGLPDAIDVAAGEQVEIGLSLSLPEPLRVVSMTPAQGTSGVGLETDVQIQFNQPAQLVKAGIRIFPPVLSVGRLTRSADGMLFTLPVTLAEDTNYRVVVETARDEEGGALSGAVSTVFTTAADLAARRSISGRLVLPQLPSARVFEGPVLIGAISADRIEPGHLSIGSFDESDIAASTIASSRDFRIDNVPEGDFVVAAFVRVQVPQGFRPPDPRQRAEPDFDLEGKRFNDQVLEVFDTIELFGFAETDEGRPRILPADTDDATVYLRGSARTREQLLPVRGISLTERSADNPSPLIVDRQISTDDQGRTTAIRLGFSEAVTFREAGAVPVGGIIDDSEGIGVEANLSVRFGKVLRVDRGIAAIEAVLDGRPLRQFRIEDEGLTIVFPVVLRPGRFQRFSVFKAESVDGGRLERPLDVALNLLLGESAGPTFGSISGVLTLQTLDEEGNELTGEDADLIDDATVILFTIDGGDLSRVGTAQVDAAGNYSLQDVLPGSYQVFAEATTASGRRLRVIHDGDGDGIADLLTIGAGGGDLTGIDMGATVILATEEDSESGTTVKTTPPGGNAGAVARLVFACDRREECSTIQSDVAVGDVVDLDLFITGVTDLDGFSAKLRYDADILEFVEAVDTADERSHLLRQNGATALILPPLLREPELEFGGALLGPTAATAVDGGGFLGRFRFRVTDEFEGAQVFLESMVLTSLTGRDDLTPAQSAKLAPQVFEEQTKGVISFDFNTAAEDQEEFHLGFITPGDLVEVDLYLNFDEIAEGFVDLVNYSVKVEFDEEQVRVLSFIPATADEANVLVAGGGKVPIFPAILDDGVARSGAAILGATAEVAPDVSGLIGRLTLATTDAFAETDLMLTAYEVKGLDTDQLNVSTLIIARMSTGEITRVAAGGSSTIEDGVAGNASGADLDGSGLVDFTDFFIFVEAFGKVAEGSAAIADLDGSGLVDFSDFFIFVESFGKTVGRVVAGQALPETTVPLTLTAASTARELVVDLRSDAHTLRGYAAELSYDADRFELLRVTDAESALRGDGRESLLLSRRQPGQVSLLGGRTAGAGPVGGLLAQLHFAPLAADAEGLFRLDAGVIREAGGQVRQVRDLGEWKGRWIPQVFALSPNYPNPFNPSTTISFQLPVSSKVSLEIYDVLGQRVRTLVDDQQVAGVHRVVWDSRNDHGQAVAAGVYFTRLQAGSFRQVQKLLLLK